MVEVDRKVGLEIAFFINFKITDLERITTSKKVEFALKEQGRNKTWLARQLSLTRPTLYDRLDSNSFTDSEILKLRAIGLI
jgi:DNA-binding NtrC family response regulator